MTTIRERCVAAMARAMYDSHRFVKPWDHPDTVRIHRSHTIHASTAAFDAVIAVLREPDEDMVYAGVGDHRCYWETAVDVWQSMLDEAAK